MNEYVAAGIGTAVAAVTSPLVLAGLKKLKSRQTISEHVAEHAHKQGTPTMGGIMILIAFFVTSALAWQPTLLQPVLLALGYGLMGFLDDYVVPRLLPGTRGLGWKEKLAFQVVLTTAVLYFGPHNGVTNVASGVFMILFFSNAYNFSDGIDGLAGTLGLILFGALCFVNPLVSLSLVGGTMVFLCWNRYPAKVFMGDVGALPIGALLGYVLFNEFRILVAENPVPQLIALTVFSLVMIAELVPVPLQILSVKLRGKRLFPKTPIHHAFQEKGWSEWKIVGVFGAAQLACVGLAWLAIKYV